MSCENHSRVPHTPASHEAWAGDGRGRDRVLPCSSLSTQVLHRRRPGRTEWAWAVAAFKYLLGPPYPHPTFPPRPWLPRTTANWRGHGTVCEEKGFPLELEVP